MDLGERTQCVLMAQRESHRLTKKMVEHTAEVYFMPKMNPDRA